MGYDGDTIAESSGIYELVEFAGRLYFAAETGETGRELWVSDGTTEGTQLVEDLRPGFNENYYFLANSSDPYSLTVVGDELFFAANDGEIGTELYKLTAEDLNSTKTPTKTQASSTAYR